MSSVVLDASAVLAVLHGERGYESVTPRLKGGLISALNYSEVLKKSIEKGGQSIPTQLVLARFLLIIVPFDEPQAIATAEMYSVTVERGLSMADRACLGLGIAKSALVLTADARMAKVDLPVKVELIR